jgi:hypothetical protein
MEAVGTDCDAADVDAKRSMDVVTDAPRPPPGERETAPPSRRVSSRPAAAEGPEVTRGSVRAARIDDRSKASLGALSLSLPLRRCLLVGRSSLGL